MPCTQLAIIAFALAGCESGASLLDVPIIALDATSDGGPDDPHAGARAACAFSAGARAADTLSDATAARAAIHNVIIVMQENHSFDQMYGASGHGLDGFPPGFSNMDASGRTVTAYHLATTTPADLPHQWTDIHAEWDDGAMDGFARDAPDAMGYFTDADHPFYTWLLNTFATSDRFFSSALAGTWPNRDYFYCGTADGVRLTGIGYPLVPCVFDAMDTAGVTWGDFVAQGFSPLESALGWTYAHPGVHPIANDPSDLLTLIDQGTLPQVSFFDTSYSGGCQLDEHPPANINDGENYVRTLIEHLFASPLWPHTALFLTYDEAGGFFDHVPPPSACIAAPNETDVDHYGLRVPIFVVSPYSRAGYVSRLVHSHVSILRFIEMLYDLPALTGRDANSDAMLDMFDFDGAAFLTPPTPLPAAGPTTPGC